MKKQLLRILLGISTNLGWFGCVFFAQKDWGQYSIIFPFLSAILLYLSFRPNLKEYCILGVLLVIGLTFDFTSAGLDLIQFQDPPQFGYLPLWMFSLWFILTASLPLLANLFKDHLFLASVIGAISGPLSYKAGDRFEILTMNGPKSIFIYSLFWAIYLPVTIYWLNKNQKTN
jgi:hypothetical protein